MLIRAVSPGPVVRPSVSPRPAGSSGGPLDIPVLIRRALSEGPLTVGVFGPVPVDRLLLRRSGRTIPVKRPAGRLLRRRTLGRRLLRILLGQRLTICGLLSPRLCRRLDGRPGGLLRRLLGGCRLGPCRHRPLWRLGIWRHYLFKG